MTTTRARGPGCATQPHLPTEHQTLRPKLMRLTARADLCPQALMRVLSFVTQHGAVPFTITAERRPRSQRFVIDMDRLPDQAANSLLAKVEAIVTVRSAKLTHPARRRRQQAAK